MKQVKAKLLSIRNRLVYALRRKPKLHCIGDSHVMVFDYLRRYRPMQPEGYRIYTCKVHGATNMGLANPNSKTRAMPIFKAYIEKHVRKEDHLLFLLGEVDCGFVIWYRSKKYAEDVQEQFDKSLGNYRSLIDFAAPFVDGKLFVCETPYPTIRDGEYMGEVANKRKEIEASQKERTDLTAKYNEALAHYCQEQSYTFLEMKADLLDPETGLVKEEIRNEDPTDHHYSDKKYSAIIVDKLNQLRRKGDG